MKLTSVSLALLACATSVSAQYFSEGWAPGKPVTQEPAPTGSPGQRRQPGAQQQQQQGGKKFSLDFTQILESDAVSNLLGKVGINITSQLEAARAQQANIFDTRIPLITDDNYDELIVRENLTKEEEEKRSWFVVITAQNTARSGLSKALDDSFDAAFNTSLIEGDLPDVRWGRIDYLNVTYLTTKWNVWQAPYLVLIRDRGQTLYFYQATSVRLTTEVLRNFLLEETWKQTNPWKTALAPGGDYEYIMHYFALALQYMYNYMVILPRWAMMLISGGIASLIMRLMHRNPEAEAAKPKAVEKKEEKVVAPASAADTTEAKGTSSSTPKKAGKSRKGGKK